MTCVKNVWSLTNNFNCKYFFGLLNNNKKIVIKELKHCPGSYKDKTDFPKYLCHGKEIHWLWVGTAVIKFINIITLRTFSKTERNLLLL